MFGEGGGDKNSKEGGWIYCLNNSIELVLIALHILCDGKEEIFALAEIHVRFIILIIRCINSFFYQNES